MLPLTIADTPTVGPPPDSDDITRLHRAHRRFMAENVSAKLPADRPLAIRHADGIHTGLLSASTDSGLPGLLAYYLDEPGLYSYGMSIYTTMGECLMALSTSRDHMAHHELATLSQATDGIQHSQPASAFRSLQPLRPAVMPNQEETRLLAEALNMAVRYARNAGRTPELPPTNKISMIHPIDAPCPLITADGVVRHQSLWNSAKPTFGITQQQQEIFRAMAEKHPASVMPWHVDLYVHPTVLQPHPSRREPPYHPVTVIYHPHDQSGQYIAVQYAGAPSITALQTTLLLAIDERKQRPPELRVSEPILMDSLAPAAHIMRTLIGPAKDERDLPQRLDEIIRHQDPEASIQFPITYQLDKATQRIRELTKTDSAPVRHRCAHVNPLQTMMMSPHPSPGTGHVKTDDLRDDRSLAQSLLTSSAYADDDLDLAEIAEIAIEAGTAPPRTRTALAVAAAITRRDPNWRRVDERYYHNDGPRPEGLPAFTINDYFRHLVFTNRS